MVDYTGLISLAVTVLSVLTPVLGVQEHTYHFAELAGLIPRHYDRQSKRPELEKGIALHLYEGDRIHISVCIERWTNISFSNLTYSNDGASENISLHFDSHYVGQFTTHSRTNWGNNWGTFYGSGYIGHSGLVPPGNHVITIDILSSKDCYGVEFGSLLVTTSKTINQGTMWCGEKHTMMPSRCLPRNDNIVTAVTTTSATTTTQIPPRYIKLQQLSHASDCVDKQNIKIAFTSDDLTGTRITVKQIESLNARDNSSPRNIETPAVRQCKSNMWQLGKVDGDNSEFEYIYPGHSLTVNLSSTPNPTKKFPAKILPFVTKEITLQFEIPKHLQVNQGGSAFFVLGLVNLTRDSQIGIQLFNTSTNSFTDIHYQTFTPTWKTRGWHLPVPRQTSHSNVIKLHFISEANVIMFDFLKMDFSLREERKQNLLIAKRGNLKIRGFRYSTSVGTTVVVDGTEIIYNIEDVVIFLKRFSRYDVVLRIHFSGVLYPYKTYSMAQTSSTQQEQQQRQPKQQMVDVSGVMFAKGTPESRDGTHEFSNKISSIYIDTPTELITINHHDGSTARLKLTAENDSTHLTVVSYHTNGNDISKSGSQTLYYVSTHVTDVVAAVNEVTAADLKAHVTSDLKDFSGEYNYTMTQTLYSPVFYANNYFNIEFPR